MKEEIESQNTPTRRKEVLLDKLMTRDEDGFKIFLESLKENYKHVYKKLYNEMYSHSKFADTTKQDDKVGTDTFPQTRDLTGIDLEENCDVFGNPVIPVRTLDDNQDRDALDGVFRPFIEFPTPDRLRAANEVYLKHFKDPKYDENEELHPQPPSKSKADIFQNEDYQKLDKHSVNAPNDLLHSSLNNLVDYLISSAKGDLQKARAIYWWIANQDLKSMGIHASSKKDTVYWNLNEIRDFRKSYTTLLLEMYSLANIHAEIIAGYGKGVSYKHEEPNDLADHTCSWIGAKIDNEWRLLNPCFGSRAASLETNVFRQESKDGTAIALSERKMRLEYAVDDHFLCTDPEESICILLPEDGKWQLLARAVTSEEFQQMVYLEDQFFKLGLTLLNQKKCNIYTDDGHVDIDIGLPTDSKLNFNGKLRITAKGKDDALAIGHIEFSKYIFLWQIERKLRCSLDFPMAGTFKFILLGSHRKTDHFQETCTFIIHSKHPKQYSSPSPCLGELGPYSGMDSLCISLANYKIASLEAEHGEIRLEFKAPDNVKMQFTLISGKSSDSLDRCTLGRPVEGGFAVDIRLPAPGQYELTVFARCRDKDCEGPLPGVGQYLVSTANCAFDPTPFPTASSGPSAENNHFQIELSSHADSYVIAPESGEIIVAFKTPVPCDFITELVLINCEEKKILNEYILMSQTSTDLKCALRFPEIGMYALDIYAKEEATQGDYSLVYTCIIQASHPFPTSCPFPTSSGSRGKRYLLLEPRDGFLQPNRKIKFAVKVDDAVDVAVINEDDVFTHLSQSNDGVWNGEVQTGEPDKYWKLCAATAETAPSFTEEFVFKVVSNEYLSELANNQATAIAKAQDKSRLKQEQEKRREELFETNKRDLLQSLRLRSIPKLREILQTVEINCFRNRLEPDIEEARKLLECLARLQRLQQPVFELDSPTMSELSDLGNPPPLVHNTLVATLLLLGELEHSTRNWTYCRKLCKEKSSTSVYKKIKQFDITCLHPEIAARARQILLSCQEKYTDAGSKTIVTLYKWAVGIIEEIQIFRDDAARAAPASSERQTEIFKILKK